MNRTVPVLITLDIHSYPKIEKEIPLWFEETLKLLDRFSIKATFFFPAVVAEKFANYVRMILDRGHEIGCHGLTHGVEEQYHLEPYERQKSFLYEAKNRLEEITGKEVISFRSPAFKISGNTIRALQENGFKMESSVNSQRLGIFSSDAANIGWMYSPRSPYHPSFKNPFIPGKSSLWEIPLSAFILPFMSNTGMAFGRGFMKLFFQLLYIESALRQNAIVYMFHPEDIYPKRDRIRYKFKWRHMLPSRKIGFEVRNILFHNKAPEKISMGITSLLETIKNRDHIKFITFNGMLWLLENNKKG